MRPTAGPNTSGFTRLDLLAVLCVLACLGAVLLPALGESERHTRAAVCGFNLKQLTAAWSAYAADHAGELPLNDYPPPTGQYDWCGSSFMDSTISNPQNWNHEVYTKRGQLWPYVLATAPFICPDDPSRARAGSGPDAGRFVPRIRSYSMNNWMNGVAWNGSWTFYTNQAQVAAGQPDQLWVLMDEHPEGINDGTFIVDMSGYPASPSQAEIVDFPAYYHGRGATLSYADGRAEVRIWRDNRTVPTTLFALAVASPNNSDIFWLQERSTRRVTVP